MAFRLNHLFQTAPAAVLERTVVFVDGLNSGQMRNRLTHFIDLEQTGKHIRARALNGLHEYQQDAPLISYFLPSAGFLQVPRDDPPNRFIFLPEFTCCRLMVYAEGDKHLRLQLEENLVGRLPPPDSSVLDSFSYWDYTTDSLVGRVRGTAVIYKPLREPWTFTMQQIVGNPGDELVRRAFTRAFKLPS